MYIEIGQRLTGKNGETITITGLIRYNGELNNTGGKRDKVYFKLGEQVVSMNTTKQDFIDTYIR